MYWQKSKAAVNNKKNVMQAVVIMSLTFTEIISSNLRIYTDILLIVVLHAKQDHFETVENAIHLLFNFNYIQSY